MLYLLFMQVMQDFDCSFKLVLACGLMMLDVHIQRLYEISLDERYTIVYNLEHALNSLPQTLSGLWQSLQIKIFEVFLLLFGIFILVQSQVVAKVIVIHFLKWCPIELLECIMALLHL